MKNITDAMLEPATHKLQVYPSTDWATQKVIKLCTNENYWLNVISIVYFERKYVT